MFSIALDMNVRDFKNLAQQPRSIIIGIIAQLFVAPLVTILLVYILIRHLQLHLVWLQLLLALAETIQTIVRT